ncbi:MAG TPA: 3-phosphoshikimate 1-carboxyvinyltransferase [Fimbriimonadaceae bacterium]|jgi:3-phosphoshikimate 1-carboxyvinyltransferase
MDLIITRAKTLQGKLRSPSDKSLTHRAYMFGAIAEGSSRILNPLVSQDCENTLECLAKMGLRHESVSADEILLHPAKEWNEPKDELYCGNSGTTIRLMSGLVASRPITAILSGDASLSKRPMKRIASPLREMGAEFIGDTPPLTIKGSAHLKGIDYVSPVASAQIKTCTLFAGLRAEGPTTIHEPSLSRDHTERMLKALGMDVTISSEERGSVSRLNAGGTFKGFDFNVPGDISSSAFWLVAASIVLGANLTLQGVGINPTRSGVLDVLTQAGVTYTLDSLRDELNEPVADITVSNPSRLLPFEIKGSLVPRLIDEIPVLAVLASQCNGETNIRDAGEMRIKESDRIELVAKGLRAMGAEVHVLEDGLTIIGPSELKGAVIETEGDHRIAMAFTIAGLIAEGETVIKDAQNIATSYPDFESHLALVRVG